MRRFLAVCCAAVFPLHATAAGWQPLFNGKDLAGWSGDPRLWRVQDGVVTGETDDSARKIAANTFLIWQGGEPGDFELELKARVTGDNNSGIQYRSKVVDPAHWIVGGYQMDMHANAPYLGMLYEERGRGIACERGQKVRLADGPQVTGKLERPEVKLGEWNTYRIVARGNLLRHYVNGRLAAEIEDVDAARQALKGVVALQLHAGPSMKAEFKDARWRSLEVPGGEPTVQWIWRSATPGAEERVFFRREFELPADIASAAVTVTCDNWHRLWVNGQDLGFAADWRNPRNYDVSSLIRPGKRNVIAVEGRNQGGSAGLALRFRATGKDGKKIYLVSDAGWQCAGEAPDGWQSPDFVAKEWPAAVSLARMGADPWGAVIQKEEGRLNDSGPEDLTGDYQVADGFQLERLYRVPKEQGSWVSITQDDKGRLLTSDQYGKIYRVEEKDGRFSARPLPIALGGAHGLLWFRGVLYVVVGEGNDTAGVWRVLDTDGDGEPDKPELMKAFQGHGEHGPHSLAVSPDGEWIYAAIGNHTDCPEFESSLPSQKWGEDQLLTRRPDPRGHAVDRFAPGGFIARFKPDGSKWELFSIGYRNQFDLGFNDKGDLFTYDSDMEWDLGMPWYRPTRICHVVPGSEFGWRNGSGVWPEYDEDSMGTQLDIGPGSPTGVVSGKGAKFPARYQQALYTLDWTYATIRAIHLTPDGRGYKAEAEEFVAGAGLPLTDAVIGDDGAMYFLTGGRRTDSALWRVTYTGDEPVAPVTYAAKPLELTDRATAWERLGAPARIDRYEGRLALEAGDPAEVAAKLAGEQDPWRIIGGAMALARTGGPEYRRAALSALGRLDLEKLDLQQKLNALRACGLVFIRFGEPTAEERTALLARIDASFPSNNETLNRELCRMLCYLQAPGIVGRTLALMDSAGPTPPPDYLELAKRNAGYGRTVEAMIDNLPPAQVIHYIYCLRAVKGPWAPDERKRFFAWFGKLLQSKGGASYEGFIVDLRKETLATCTPEEREWVSKLDTGAPRNPFADLPKAKGPGREWTIDEVVKLAGEGGLQGRDKENGRRMFQAALCIVCHRSNGEGGAAGPDLSALGGRFQVRDLAEAILDPSKVVSDQYTFDAITKTDGSQVIGKLLEEKDDHWIVATSPFDFSQTVEIERNQIKEMKHSPVSPMPPGLINSLNPDELKDLLAYLLGK